MFVNFNEDTRVKIPALVHLGRLGFSYVSLKTEKWDRDTNIFSRLFAEGIQKINPDITGPLLHSLKREIGLLLDNEDLGRAFYDRLIQPHGLRLIDFEHFDNNSFHVVTELPCVNGDEEFRPDITLLVNGLPLVFIEVKKPNNRDGILAERSRIRARCRNPKFRRFLNLTQLMVFSNNMEYDDQDPEPLQGAFYASPSYDSPAFNYFREEHPFPPELLSVLDTDSETLILTDNNQHALRHAQEYQANLSADTPTNRILTSLFRRERLAFLLRYGLAYVRTSDGFEKHVMRYPQIFATLAIDKALAGDVRKGIIWHTQGSGKTALAFYNVRHLTDRFQARGIVPKFYFIVDRIDLQIQAAKAFGARGLVVHTIQTREQFAADIKSNSAIHNTAGKLEITVVNIQKFQDDPDVVRAGDYDVRLQRIYFLDEVHRSYNPGGSFLANLVQSDRNAILLGLTGTPLLGSDHNSRALFGDYLHKYYYNASIADGYTLRLIREEIATGYKLVLKQTLEQIKVLQSRENRETVYASESFVRPLLDYILEDFEKARRIHNAPDIGAMVVCDSAAQARALMERFETLRPARRDSQPIPFPDLTGQGKKIAAETAGAGFDTTARDHKPRRAALILHDEGDKDERKEQIDAFKEGRVDILFVYNMLLTGFDAPRLKKLYLGRLIRAHNLLQALTRVNRTYKNFRYGYVVDFADIEEEFKKTNQAYFDELQSELGDELKNYSNLFKSPGEIIAECGQIQDALCHFNLENAETFSRQISEIQDRAAMLEIVRALDNARDLYNLIRQSGQYELLESLDFRQLALLRTEARNHLSLINQKLALEQHTDTANILNLALEDILFTFRKVCEKELRIADELREALRRAREALGGNFDPFDPVFRNLREELERLFKKKNLSEISQEEMKANISVLERLFEKARELNRRNELIRAKYENDAKYARLHKRLREKADLNVSERKLFEALGDLKREADLYIFQNARLLQNEAFARKEMTRIVYEQLQTQHNLLLTPAAVEHINNLILSEYLHEFNGVLPA